MLKLTYTLTLTHRHNITLTGGTFDLFDGNCDGQNGLDTHLPVKRIVFYVDGNVDARCKQSLSKAHTQMQTLRVNRV